jgi:hypothetical protein
VTPAELQELRRQLDEHRKGTSTVIKDGAIVDCVPVPVSLIESCRTALDELVRERDELRSGNAIHP